MIKKLRILFTFTGIMLLLGAIVTDEWASFGERFSYAIMAICILIACQPSATIHFLQWLWDRISELFRTLRFRSHNSKLLKQEEPKEEFAAIENHGDSAPCKSYRIEEFNKPDKNAYPDPVEYTPPIKISRGNITLLSDEDMHIFLLHYYKAAEIRTKVKGVTYRNSDGTNRQNILAHCHTGDPLRFEAYKYKGEPAYAVHCDWGQIGNLSADLAEEIAAREKPCIILGEILNVSGGYHGEYFGCNIRVDIYEKHEA